MGTHIYPAMDMGAMKTTLEISDPLLREARKIASRENTTLRALVEQGLRRVVAEKKKDTPFQLRDASVGGKGLHPDVAGKSWDEIRDMIYEEAAPDRR
jgi:Bacterial antitoxin of type II TA system, VapB